jgi:trimethylamine--corrinoid protein Co-methyltransferase
VLSLMQCTISPLAHDGGPIEASLVAAEAGVPVGFMTMASCAFSGPATIAGSLVVGNAEVITALALMQLAHPGAPVYYAAAQTAMDLRSGAYTGGGPEDFLFGAATNALADFYNVPLSMGAFATGAKRPDWQAGLENGLSGLASLLAGADMCSGAGLLHAARVYSLDDLVLDTEIWSLLAHFARGIPLSDDDLAVEVIATVGPAGDFLTEHHTLAHMRQLWQPRYFDRRTWEDWEAAGRPTPPDRAHDRVRAILESHVVMPLPEGVPGELDRIVDAFDARVGVR